MFDALRSDEPMIHTTHVLPAEQLRELVAAASRLAELGLTSGTSGNVSVRLDDVIVMSPTGADLSELHPDNLSVLDFEGTLLSGPEASKEFPFHRAMYERDQENRAIVHVHSSHAVAISCTKPWSQRSAIPPLTPYFVMRVGQTPLIPYAPPGDGAHAAWIAKLSFPFRAALLENHGLIAAGASMQKAMEATIELEEVCKLMLLLRDYPTHALTREQACELAAKYSSPWTP